MILKFSKLILQKEWKGLMLPFLSVLLTGTVVATSFLLIDSAKDYVTTKNKEILGGDVVFEAAKQFDLNDVLDKSLQKKVSEQIRFNALLSSGGTSSEVNSSASLRFVDNNFPLYGEIKVSEGVFETPKVGQIYVDESLAKSLSVKMGDRVWFNNTSFIVKGIVTSDPENLVPSFNFSGKAIFSVDSIEYSGIDLNLFRKEFQKKVVLSQKLSNADISLLREKSRSVGVRGVFDGAGQGSLQFGLSLVEKFLVVTILIISVLSLVNIYASVNYLSNRLRRSFAILISLGMNLKAIYQVLFLVNLVIIFIGTIAGIVLGWYITSFVSSLTQSSLQISMVVKTNLLEFLYIFLAIFVASIFATFPAINRMRNISPKELLSHNDANKDSKTIKSILFDVLIGILPITVLSIYFLDSFLYGGLTILLIVVVYAGLMFFYSNFITIVYKYREVFNFPLKMITAQKKFDGFFGLITFASLFVALTAIYNLSIIRTSIDDYLRQDLKSTLPSTYILDIQSSQKGKLLQSFPEIVLFPNVRARISSIDQVDILKAVEERKEGVDRELGREFNLTYRDSLLPSEKIIQQEDGRVFENMGAGEVSLEKDFAQRANIKLGSNIEFLVQGITLKARVTSIREVDTRSGYPFFYFIFSPKTLESFPATLFGYANYDTVAQSKLRTYLASEIPNASLIDTINITKIAEELIGVLLLVVLIITLPPLFLSGMLIVTILASVAKDRKRDGARLMALGKTHTYVRNYYILESTSTVVLASFFAYIFALVVSNFVIFQYLKIDNLVYLDSVSFLIFVFILFGILLTSLILWRAGGKSLKEYLNYEENN